MSLTWRMKNWLENQGAHIAVADKQAWPTVIVSDRIVVSGELITVEISDSQKLQLQPILVENNFSAVAPGNLGSIRAPYQFKGVAKMKGNQLEISVTEIYCTKPGAEAGIRLDVLGEVGIKEFDESRWTDGAPGTN